MIERTLKTDACPAEDMLNGYLIGVSGDTERETIEKHLAGCPYCLYRIAEAHVVLEESGLVKTKGDFMDIVKKVNVWFLSCVVMFALSFIFRSYFIQFLAAAVICGIKWIVDNKNTKMLVMIYEAWKHGGGKEAEELIKKLDSRMRR